MDKSDKQESENYEGFEAKPTTDSDGTTKINDDDGNGATTNTNDTHNNNDTNDNNVADDDNKADDTTTTPGSANPDEDFQGFEDPAPDERDDGFGFEDNIDDADVVKPVEDITTAGKGISRGPNRSSGRWQTSKTADSSSEIFCVEKKGRGLGEGGLHINARSEVYPGSHRVRVQVEDWEVSWNAVFEEYAPEFYIDPISQKQDCDWSDKEGDVENIQFNEPINDQNKVTRESFVGKYSVNEKTKLPYNPCGRTGIQGLGILGRWGPNRAADPIVTRWKRDGQTVVVDDDGDPVLEWVAIERHDNGKWAIPGGFVDPGESVGLTLRREFGEEALNTQNMKKDDREMILKQLSTIWESGVQLYQGYMDDERNTDNSWIETTCYSFHDGTGYTNLLPFSAGDDAAKVRWMSYTRQTDSDSLHANHGTMVAMAYDSVLRRSPPKYETFELLDVCDFDEEEETVGQAVEEVVENPVEVVVEDVIQEPTPPPQLQPRVGTQDHRTDEQEREQVQNQEQEQEQPTPSSPPPSPPPHELDDDDDIPPPAFAPREPPPSEVIQSGGRPWFHGALNAVDCEARLSQEKGLSESGRFLVRQQLAEEHTNKYIISVVFSGRYTHHSLVMGSEGVLLNNDKLEGIRTMEEAVEHLRSLRPKWPLSLTSHAKIPGSDDGVAVVVPDGGGHDSDSDNGVGVVVDGDDDDDDDVPPPAYREDLKPLVDDLPPQLPHQEIDEPQQEEPRKEQQQETQQEPHQQEPQEEPQQQPEVVDMPPPIPAKIESPVKEEEIVEEVESSQDNSSTTITTNNGDTINTTNNDDNNTTTDNDNNNDGNDTTTDNDNDDNNKDNNNDNTNNNTRDNTATLTNADNHTNTNTNDDDNDGFAIAETSEVTTETAEVIEVPELEPRKFARRDSVKNTSSMFETQPLDAIANTNARLLLPKRIEEDAPIVAVSVKGRANLFLTQDLDKIAGDDDDDDDDEQPPPTVTTPAKILSGPSVLNRANVFLTKDLDKMEGFGFDEDEDADDDVEEDRAHPPPPSRSSPSPSPSSRSPPPVTVSDPVLPKLFKRKSSVKNRVSIFETTKLDSVNVVAEDETFDGFDEPPTQNKTPKSSPKTTPKKTRVPPATKPKPKPSAVRSSTIKPVVVAPVTPPELEPTPDKPVEEVEEETFGASWFGQTEAEEKDNEFETQDNKDVTHESVTPHNPTPWYHGILVQPMAEERLSSGLGLADTGRFLVRQQPADEHTTKYIVSVVFSNRYTHHALNIDDDCVTLNGGALDASVKTLEDAVEHLRELQPRWPLRLTTYPEVPETVEPPEIILRGPTASVAINKPHVSVAEVTNPYENTTTNNGNTEHNNTNTNTNTNMYANTHDGGDDTINNNNANNSNDNNNANTIDDIYGNNDATSDDNTTTTTNNNNNNNDNDDDSNRVSVVEPSNTYTNDNAGTAPRVNVSEHTHPYENDDRDDENKTPPMITNEDNHADDDNDDDNHAYEDPETSVVAKKVDVQTELPAESEQETYDTVEADEAQKPPLLLPKNPLPPATAESWHHGVLSVQLAEERLATGVGLKETGRFLIRQQPADVDTDRFIVSVVFGGRFTHHALNIEEGGAVVLNGQSLDASVTTLADAVEHLREMRPKWPLRLSSHPLAPPPSSSPSPPPSPSQSSHQNGPPLGTRAPPPPPMDNNDNNDDEEDLYETPTLASKVPPPVVEKEKEKENITDTENENENEWDHGIISKEEAEDRLYANDGKNELGRFLIHQRQEDVDDHKYILSVIYNGRVTHHMISIDNSVVHLNNKQIDDSEATSLPTLVAHLRELRPYWPVRLTTTPTK